MCGGGREKERESKPILASAKEEKEISFRKFVARVEDVNEANERRRVSALDFMTILRTKREVFCSKNDALKIRC